MSTWAITRRMPEVCPYVRSDGRRKASYLCSAPMTGILAGALAALAAVLGVLVWRIRASEARARRDGEALEAAERVARVGSFRLDLGSWQTSWSDELYRIQGLQPGECDASFERFLDAVHPEDRDGFEHVVRSSVRASRPFAADCRLLVPGHGQRVVHCRGEVMLGRGERVRTVVGTVQDVTELRRTEEELAHRALHDPVTELANRVAVEETI